MTEINTTTKPSARILVVDDEDVVRTFIARVLQNAGHTVDTAENGQRALAMIDAGQHYDLIVSDVHMPEMSGPEFVARLRSTGLPVKVLYLTGYSEQLSPEDHHARWTQEAYLEKPASASSITEAVALLLSRPPR